MKFLWLLFILITSSSLFAQKSEWHRYEYTQPHMGTVFRIILYADNGEKAEHAATAAFHRVAELNKILSDYDPNSELSRLSATAGKGQAVRLSPDLWYILEKSLKISAQTNGAFDITIGPIVQLWRRSRRQYALPAPEALIQAKRAVGYRHVRLNAYNKTAQLLVPGMQLDMGAIGKGYAVDEAMKTLKKYKIKSALVDGGGNILVSHAPPGSPGWEIDFLPYPGAEKGQKPKILLTNRGVATSGDLYQQVEINGVHYSHIVNPFTGLGLTNESRVSVIAQNATDADWLSTALSVLQPAAGQALIQKVPKAATLVQMNTNGTLEQWQSGRFIKYLKKKE